MSEAPLDVVMRVCIPTVSPGGPDASLPDHFDLMETIDYYDLDEDGQFEHVTETRYCGGGCYDIVEAMVRRGVKALIVRSISPYTLWRSASSDVGVFFAGRNSPRTSLRLLAEGKLPELDSKTQTRRL